MSRHKNDILPDDGKLFDRVKIWTELCDKYAFDNEEVEIKTTDLPYLDSNEEKSSESSSNSTGEFVDNIVPDEEQDPDFDIKKTLNDTLQIVQKRERNWHRNGMEKALGKFDINTDEKVQNWIKNNESRNCSPLFGPMDFVQKTHFCNKEFIVGEEYISEDDSLQSINTAKYILSNRKKIRSAHVTRMTIKQFCYSNRQDISNKNKTEIRTKSNNNKNFENVFKYNKNISKSNQYFLEANCDKIDKKSSPRFRRKIKTRIKHHNSSYSLESSSDISDQCLSKNSIKTKPKLISKNPRFSGRGTEISKLNISQKKHNLKNKSNLNLQEESTTKRKLFYKDIESKNEYQSEINFNVDSIINSTEINSNNKKKIKLKYRRKSSSSDDSHLNFERTKRSREKVKYRRPSSSTSFEKYQGIIKKSNTKYDRDFDETVTEKRNRKHIRKLKDDKEKLKFRDLSTSSNDLPTSINRAENNNTYKNISNNKSNSDIDNSAPSWTVKSNENIYIHKPSCECKLKKSEKCTENIPGKPDSKPKSIKFKNYSGEYDKHLDTCVEASKTALKYKNSFGKNKLKSYKVQSCSTSKTDRTKFFNIESNLSHSIDEKGYLNSAGRTLQNVTSSKETSPDTSAKLKIESKNIFSELTNSRRKLSIKLKRMKLLKSKPDQNLERNKLKNIVKESSPTRCTIRSTGKSEEENKNNKFKSKPRDLNIITPKYESKEKAKRVKFSNINVSRKTIPYSKNSFVQSTSKNKCSKKLTSDRSNSDSIKTDKELISDEDKPKKKSSSSKVDIHDNLKYNIQKIDISPKIKTTIRNDINLEREVLFKQREVVIKNTLDKTKSKGITETQKKNKQTQSAETKNEIILSDSFSDTSEISRKLVKAQYKTPIKSIENASLRRCSTESLKSNASSNNKSVLRKSFHGKQPHVILYDPNVENGWKKYLENEKITINKSTLEKKIGLDLTRKFLNGKTSYIRKFNNKSTIIFILPIENDICYSTDSEIDDLEHTADITHKRNGQIIEIFEYSQS